MWIFSSKRYIIEITKKDIRSAGRITRKHAARNDQAEQQPEPADVLPFLKNGRKLMTTIFQ